MSLLDRLDPRTRVCALACYAVVTVLLRDEVALMLAVAVGILLAAAGRALGPGCYRRLLGVSGLVLFLLLTLPLSTPGTPVVEFALLVWSREGVLLALRIGLIASAIVFAASGLVGAMEPATLGHALSRLGAPDALVHIFLSLIRYSDELLEEYRRLRGAMRLRAFRFTCTAHGLRSVGYLLGMLLVRSVARSERVLAAMKCRGFQGRWPVLTRMQFARADALFGAVMAMMLGGMGWLAWA